MSPQARGRDGAHSSTIRLDDLRHTHASHLLVTRVNVKVVSDRLGHASVSTYDRRGGVGLARGPLTGDAESEL
jgi:integrase